MSDARFLPSLCLLLAVLMLAGCGNKGALIKPPPTPATPAVTPPPIPPSVTSPPAPADATPAASHR